jgi:hypothetical protein
MSIIKSGFIAGNSLGIVDNAKLNDDPAVHARFAAVTDTLRAEQKKRGATELSPYVDDFLYASCIMMHAAESALINQETGEVIKTADGKSVAGWFERYDAEGGRETARWVSPDGIRPTKNNNGDIFPETELLKAYKNWIGKPLCKDHVSSSVDGIRGVIVDTFYDPKFKRVHALFALDKKNYPDLARKVEAGYATNVSMGTAVGRSICSECQNVATVASEFCGHVKARTHYGEINLDLNPIELSIVVTGADPRAKIRKIVASLDEYRAQADALRKIKGIPLEALAAVDGEIGNLQEDIERGTPPEDVSLDRLFKLIGFVEANDERTGALGMAASKLFEYMNQVGLSAIHAALLTSGDNKSEELFKALSRIKNLSDSEDMVKEASKVIGRLTELALGASDSVTNATAREQLAFDGTPSSATGSSPLGDDARSGTGTKGPMTGDPTGTASSGTGIDPFGRNSMSGGHGSPPEGDLFGLASVYRDVPLKKGAAEYEKDSNAISERITSIKNSLDSLKSCLPTQKAGVGTGDIMTFDELRKRANLRKKAYMQGTEEPKAYAPMGDPDLRDGDHHLHGEELDTSVANPDQKVKEMLHRASLNERRAARADKLRAISANLAVAPMGSNKAVVVDQSSGKGHVVQMADDDDADDQDADDKDLMKAEADLLRRLEILKEAAKKKGKKDPKKDMKYSEEDKKDMKAMKGDKDSNEKGAKPMKKKAYPQGTEEPKAYAPMGDPDLRDGDHHLGGKELDTKVGNPDQKVKELIQRAGLKARLTKSANLGRSRWSVLAGDKEVFSVTAGDAYNVHLNKQSDVAGKTWGELFVSPEYGKQLMAQIRAGNISKLAAELDAAKESAADAPMPAPPADAGMAALPAPGPMVEPAPEPAPGKEADDMKDRVMGALEKLEGCVADLKSAVLGDDAGVSDVDVDAPMAATASLQRGMFEAHASLNSLASELRFLARDANLADPSVRLAARAAIRDSHLAVIEANERVAAYQDACAEDDAMALDDKELDQVAEEVESAIDEHIEGDPSHDDLEQALDDLREELKALEDKVEDVAELVEEKDEDEDEEKEADAMDDMSKRAAMRQQLVARAAKMDMVSSDPMLNVHGKGEGKLDFGMKTTGDADSDVQSVFEAQEMAMKAMEGVKKAAAGIATAVRQGTIKESQLDALVAVAAVDAEAVKYYREYFGKVDSEFAKGLVSEFKKSASSNEDIGFRYKRAYAVAIDAQTRGLISQGRAALDECAETLATGNDANFDSFKRMVGNVKPQARTAGIVPQMGVVDGGESNTRTASDKGSVDVRDWRSLGKALFDI